MEAFQQIKIKVFNGQYSKNKKIVMLLKNSDEKAFAHIFDTLYEKLMAYTMGYTKDKTIAEDIVQQSFIKLWERRKNLDEDTLLPAFMFTLCRNHFIDNYRKDKKRILLSDELYFESVLELETEPDERTATKTQLLDDAINRLPVKCKEVFLLKQKENLRNKEIANYLGISEKTVEDHISRAMRLLRKDLLNFLIFILFYKSACIIL